MLTNIAGHDEFEFKLYILEGCSLYLIYLSLFFYSRTNSRNLVKFAGSPLFPWIRAGQLKEISGPETKKMKKNRDLALLKRAIYFSEFERSFRVRIFLLSSLKNFYRSED